VSEWAAACPECGGNLDDAIPIADEPVEPRPEPVPVEPNRVENGRRGRSSPRARAVIVAIVAASAVVGIAVFDIAGSSTPRLAPPGLDSYTVVYTGDHGVRVVPLNGGRQQTPTANLTGPPVATSNGVGFVQAGTAYFLASPFTGPPRPLAPADGLFPMLWPGTLGAARRLDAGIATAAYLDVEAGTSPGSSQWRFPFGYQPIGQFLAVGPAGQLRTWVPGAGGTVQLAPPLGRAVAVIGSNGAVVAWLAAGACAADGECPLDLTATNLAPGSNPTSTVAPPPGHHGYLEGGALSPDGQYLATFVAGPPDRPGQARLVIIDRVTAQAMVVPDSAIVTSGGFASAQWTPDQAYVLFSGPGGLMHAYRVGDATAITLNIKGSDSFAVF
jgi:hypothetical protein